MALSTLPDHHQLHIISDVLLHGAQANTGSLSLAGFLLLHGQEERRLPDAVLLVNVDDRRVAQAAKHGGEIAPLAGLVEWDDRAGAAGFKFTSRSKESNRRRTTSFDGG